MQEPKAEEPAVLLAGICHWHSHTKGELSLAGLCTASATGSGRPLPPGPPPAGGPPPPDLRSPRNCQCQWKRLGGALAGRVHALCKTRRPPASRGGFPLAVPVPVGAVGPGLGRCQCQCQWGCQCRVPVRSHAAGGPLKDRKGSVGADWHGGAGEFGVLLDTCYRRHCQC